MREKKREWERRKKLKREKDRVREFYINVLLNKKNQTAKIYFHEN